MRGQMDNMERALRMEIATKQLEIDKLKRINEIYKINTAHQKLNGKLQEELSDYKDKAAHYRKKAVL